MESLFDFELEFTLLFFSIGSCLPLLIDESLCVSFVIDPGFYPLYRIFVPQYISIMYVGDGIKDIIVSAPKADPGTPERLNAGKVYVIYGVANTNGYTLDLLHINSSLGFEIWGENPHDELATAITISDVNGTYTTCNVFHFR